MSERLAIFKSRPVIILISALWGLGLATLFASISNMRTVIIVRGLPPDEIEKKVFQYPDESKQCYRYKAELTPCDLETHLKVKVEDKK